MTNLKEVLHFIVTARQEDIEFLSKFLSKVINNVTVQPEAVVTKVANPTFRTKPRKWKIKKVVAKRKPLNEFRYPNGISAKLWTALTQSTGGVSTNELSTILELKPHGVQNAMRNLFNHSRYGRYITRESVKRLDGNGDPVGREYRYFYIGKK